VLLPTDNSCAETTSVDECVRGASTNGHAVSWLGLLLGDSAEPIDVRALREILGAGAPVLLVDPQDSVFATVHRMVSTGATGIVALAHERDDARFAPLLRVACSLASFRRVIVLHDDAPLEAVRHVPGLILLRDCEAGRDALREIVARETAPSNDTLYAAHAPARALASPR
jgi:hypothetical protein